MVHTGAWYHVAAVRGTNFTQIYVNGQLEGQTNVTFAQNYGTLPLCFGSSGQSYWDHKLKGSLDEVSLYNRPLSAGEIAGTSAAGASVQMQRRAVLLREDSAESQPVTLPGNTTLMVPSHLTP